MKGKCNLKIYPHLLFTAYQKESMTYIDCLYDI